MNMKICCNISVIIATFIFCSIAAFSQEKLVPLQSNPAYSTVEQPTYTAAKKALSLPFIDDFSTTNVHPDEKLWLDNYVYINNTLANNPPTMGVATFDGLNQEGKPWSPANIGDQDTRASQPCDTLTSQAIDLLSANNPENLYLSFYYQPGGNATRPEMKDSLFIQAKTENDEWEVIWSIEGLPNRDFKSVVIHLGDSAQYIHDNFQFRFIANATPTGYNDFWHIDYVELRERSNVTNQIVLLPDSVPNSAYTILVDAKKPDCRSIKKIDLDLSLSGFQNCDIDSIALVNERGNLIAYTKFSVATTIPDEGLYLSTQITNEKNDDPRTGNLSDDCYFIYINNTDSTNVNIFNYSISNDCLTITAPTLPTRDLAFVEKPTSILKDYSQMTIGQFFNYQDQVLNEQHSFTISNLDKDVFPTDYYFQIEVLNSNDIIYELEPGSISVPAYSRFKNALKTLKFTNNPNEVDDNTIAISGRDLAEETLQIEMKYFITPNNDNRNENNTISRIYTFDNQLAYDDGILDVGYGVSGESAQIAQKYEIFERDFVYGILIHFAQITLNQTDRLFTLKLWDSIKGIDGAESTVIAAMRSDLEVVYPNEDNYTGFVLYCFEDGIPVQDQFYIGIQQEGSVEIHLGFDNNNDSKDKLYFNTFNEWIPSSETGSLMMRPIIGRALSLEEDCGVETVCPVLGQECTDANGNVSMYDEDCTCILVVVGIFDQPSPVLDFTILPNPATDFIALENITQNQVTNASIHIINATGKLMKSFTGIQESYYIGDISPGIYFIRVINEQQQSGIKKFIKTK